MSCHRVKILRKAHRKSSKVHTDYEPGSFVPLLRISQVVDADSPKTEAEATEANARGLLALASKHGKPEKSANPDDKAKAPIQLPGFGTAQWAALSSSFAQVAQKGYPEHMKTILRQGGLDPDKLIEMAKAAIAQQTAEQTAKLTIQMYHCNHLGTPIALINTQGMIDWAVELDPWGNVLNEFNPKGIDQPIRMQGQQVDRESGLFYNRHRYYDPAMGRYITQDPIGLWGGFNPYSYVKEKPLSFTDPRGLQACAPQSPRQQGEALWNKAGEKISAVTTPVTDFVKSIFTKAGEGVNFSGSVGGMKVAGLGVSSTIGAAVDTASGKSCVVSSVCGLIGPMIGASTSASGSVSTGNVTPGDVSWQLGGVGTAVVGWGGKAEFSIASDGAIAVQAGPSLGGALGGAIQVCRQEVTKTCN
jgi:RHS repeat-associated protein